MASETQNSGLSFLRKGLLLNRRLLRRFAPRNDERLDFSVIARPALQAVAISRTNKVVRQQTRKQEPRLLDGPGFRIKCGMTARRAADGEIDAEFDYFLCKTKPISEKVK